ncbi:MAG: CdaR family protein [Desulfobulbaceae bacterium]|nr:CdaR family protein [Desulfobulbaceae bacterium]
MEKLVKQITSFLPKQGDPLPWAKNWAIKLLSLFFAIFLWYFVVGEDKVDMTVHIPVEIVNLPRDLVISNQFKKQLEVTVAGPRGLIRGIANQHVSRAVDLSKATPGSMLVRNDEDAISFPRGIRVLRVQPPYINLLLDRLIQRELPIKAQLTGKPDNGFEIESIIFEPPVLSLTGPQAVLGNETQLKTASIDVRDLTAPVTKEVSLKLKPAISELIGETTVTAHINIVEKTLFRRANDIPLTIKNLASPYSATSKPTYVNIKADVPISLNKNNNNIKDLFNATVSAVDLTPGKHTIAVRVEKDPRIKIHEISPATVTLTITSPARKK